MEAPFVSVKIKNPGIKFEQGTDIEFGDLKFCFANYGRTQAHILEFVEDIINNDGSVPATNLKVSGVAVFSVGDFLGALGTEQIVDELRDVLASHIQDRPQDRPKLNGHADPDDAMPRDVAAIMARLGAGLYS